MAAMLLGDYRHVVAATLLATDGAPAIVRAAVAYAARGATERASMVRFLQDYAAAVFGAPLDSHRLKHFVHGATGDASWGT